MYDYEDYYDEPSEFERQIEEFKDGLIKAVKREHQEEMARLREENAELQGIKKRMTEIKSEHSAALRKLEQEMERCKRTALITLLNETQLIMYVPEIEYSEKPKCDKCNDNRQIEFTTPSGRTQRENCLCADKNKLWKPAEAIRYEFCQSSYNNGNIVAWYKKIEKRDDHVCIKEYDSGNVRKCYDGKPYKDLSTYDIMFKTADDCQKYCDWLNEKEKPNV